MEIKKLSSLIGLEGALMERKHFQVYLISKYLDPRLAHNYVSVLVPETVF